MTIESGRRTLALAALASLWLAVSGLLVVSRGDPEGFLVSTLGRFSRDDAFKHLNSGLPIFWFVHSALVATAIAAARSRRSDVLLVLLIGPALALTINLFCQQWSDPNWYVFVAVDAIGWLVSAIVGGMYWVLKPTAAP